MLFLNYFININSRTHLCRKHFARILKWVYFNLFCCTRFPNDIGFNPFLTTLSLQSTACHQKYIKLHFYSSDIMALTDFFGMLSLLFAYKLTSWAKLCWPFWWHRLIFWKICLHIHVWRSYHHARRNVKDTAKEFKIIALSHDIYFQL